MLYRPNRKIIKLDNSATPSRDRISQSKSSLVRYVVYLRYIVSVAFGAKMMNHGVEFVLGRSVLLLTGHLYSLF